MIFGKGVVTLLILIVFLNVGEVAYAYFTFGGLRGSLSSILLIVVATISFLACLIVAIIQVWRSK